MRFGGVVRNAEGKVVIDITHPFAPILREKKMLQVEHKGINVDYVIRDGLKPDNTGNDIPAEEWIRRQ